MLSEKIETKMKIKPFILATVLIIGSGDSFGADLNKLYEKDYKAFWHQWTQNKENALSCSSPNKTADFLSDAVETLGNAEVTEANAKEIEHLIIANPKCFLDGLQKHSHERQKRIITAFIIRPIFKDKDKIERRLNEIWSKKQYKIQKQIYDEANNSK